MRELALNIPGFTTPIPTPPGLRSEFNTLGDLLSGLFDVVLLIAGFLMFFWIAWGVFEYIFAGGNKDGLAKARSRIIYAIIGFIIVLLAFAISQFFQDVSAPNTVPIKTIRQP